MPTIAPEENTVTSIDWGQISTDSSLSSLRRQRKSASDFCRNPPCRRHYDIYGRT